MAPERRRNELILVAALAVLAVAAYRLWPSPSAATAAAANERVAAGAPGAAVEATRPEVGAQGVAGAASESSAGAPEAISGEQEAAAPAPRATAGAPAARTKRTLAVEAPSVHLSALDADRPKPVTAERNLFRFKPKPTPPPAPASSVTRTDGPTPPVPTGPPPPPPIALKFIGVVDQGGQKGKLAVLSDSAGHVFQGREGDIIEGRYRLLKIGVESLDIAYLDGTGRRTVRLSGG